MSEHVALREYIEGIMDEREKAAKLTRENLETRMDHLNSFKEEWARKENTFASRESVSILSEKLADIKGSLRVLIPLSAIAGGIVGAALSLTLK